jgi:hypothetical protein
MPLPCRLSLKICFFAVFCHFFALTTFPPLLTVPGS